MQRRSVCFIASFMMCLFVFSKLYAQKPQQKAAYSLRPLKSSRWHDTPQGRWDDEAGVPRSLYHVNYGPLSGTPEEMARTYLLHSRTKFKMKNALEDIRTTRLQETPGGHHVRFEQLVQGIPVYKSDVVVNINRKNSVTYVSNNYKPGISVPSIQPSLSKETALQHAHDFLQLKGKIFGTENAQLMIYAEDETPRLSYRVTVSCPEPSGAWEIFVDAQTGEILRAEDTRVFDKPHAPASPSKSAVYTNGTGYVFIPDPLTSAGMFYGSTPGYTDNNNADSPELTAQLKLVPLRNITQNGSTYSLSGPYVRITDWEAPVIDPVTATNPDSFRFTRSQTGFEDVNVYYHVDSSQRRVQQLGYSNVQNAPLEIDTHGEYGRDNSYYDNILNAISLGQGGVDDGEDADVFIHEYGHALQWGIIPDFGDTTGGNEEGMISEGGADYWAGSYSRFLNPTFSRDFIFTWDAGFNGTTGTIWPGRPLNYPASYPPNGVRGMEVHFGGEYWSSVLMLIWDDIGRDVMDKLVLESYFYIGSFATMRDNAQAILQADNDIFAGAHLQQIAARFTQRNFIASAQFVHQPLKDSENPSGPYSVTTVVHPGYFPNASGGIKLFWGRDTTFIDSVTLIPTGNPDEYTGAIPGNDQPAHYRYYFSATNSVGTTTFYPPTAPAAFFSFYVGTDTIRPTATHTPLYDPARLLWPPDVRVIAKDNAGIDSVWVEYIRQRGNLNGTFPLFPTNDSTYQAPFGLDTTQLIVGDSIYYRVIVKDIAQISNMVTFPDSGYNKFKVTKIKVLVGSLFSSSCAILYNTLVTKNLAVDSLPWQYVTASTLPKYDLVIASAGTRSAPNFSLRPDMVKRVEGGGKLWVEGGDIGSYFRRPDGGSGFDTKFRREVLHDSAWISDATTSDLNLTAPGHALFKKPNTITSPVTFSTFTAAADRDAMTLIPGDPAATSVAEWSGIPGSAGIIINTPTGAITPLSIFFPFALSSITDSTVAMKLIENTVVYFYPVLIPAAVKDEHPSASLPTSFVLEQNFPNPFNPSTVIRYQLPAHSRVTLKIYNVLGQEVKTLVDEVQSAGYRSVKFDAGTLASSMYFYRLEATSINSPRDSFIQVKKMLLLK